MKNIVETLKVNSKSKVHNDKDEEFFEKTSTSLLSEVQGDTTKNGEYHTYSYADGQKKFKMGFLYYNKYDEFVGIQAFNNATDFADMLGVDVGAYDELDHLKIGESTEIDEAKIIRIW